jgi:pimeloyl-ACP methyl ester carboxylesterase
MAIAIVLFRTRNGEILAERIPGARLVLLPQAGHVFFTDQPQQSQTEIMGFLRQQSAANKSTARG